MNVASNKPLDAFGKAQTKSPDEPGFSVPTHARTTTWRVYP